MTKGSKCALCWKACSCSDCQHLIYTLFAKEWNVFSFFKLLLLYIDWIRVSHGWFRKRIFCLSLPGRVTSCYGRYFPWGRQLVTQPAILLSHPMGQTCSMINVSPKQLAKPHSLSGLLTLWLEQMPCRALCTKYSFFSSSHTAALSCWALSYKILKFCRRVTSTTITGGTKPGLATSTSSRSPFLLPETSFRKGPRHIHRFT